MSTAITEDWIGADSMSRWRVGPMVTGISGNIFHKVKSHAAGIEIYNNSSKAGHVKLLSASTARARSK